jgi:hypothetical protein
MARGTDLRRMTAASAAIGGGLGVANLVIALITATWRAPYVLTWTVTSLVLLALSVASAAHLGPLLRGLRQIGGVMAAAGAGSLFLGSALWLWAFATSPSLLGSPLWRESFGVVLRHELVPAVVCAALAVVLLSDGPGLLPGRRLQVALLAGSSAAVVAGAVVLSQQFVQRGESLDGEPAGLLACTVLALVLLTAVAAVGRVRLSDALVLLAGTVLLYVAGILLAAVATRHDGLLGGIKQMVPALAASALALAAAPALRRHETSI